MASLLLFDPQNLRLDDLPAVRAAADSGVSVVPLFVMDDDTARPLGGAARWWLHHALADLAAQLTALGSRLILRRGATQDVVHALARDIGAESVFLTRAYDAPWADMQSALHSALGEDGIKVKRYAGPYLFEPEAIKTQEGKPYTVFSPFWKNCLSQPEPPRPGDAPDALRVPDSWPESNDLDDFELLPTTPDWAGGLRDSWTPTRAGGLARMQDFLDEAAAKYKDRRDRPDMDGTSRLSPYLRFGQIGIREVFWAGEDAIALDGGAEKGVRKFLAELGWREFSAHLLYHFPDMRTAPLRENFENFPWEKGPSPELEAWQKGRTGFPFVDAGLRQLWHTGWMHNRVRMVVASFLVKEMLWHWHDGEAWFWDTLVDADAATNAASWQWAAGCGADAAPYFRIFNPMTQGEKFDPKGDYVRQWVLELKDMPAKHIHTPWEAPEDVLKEAGVTLGDTYPKPILDRRDARERALAAFETVKAKPGRLTK